MSRRHKISGLTKDWSQTHKDRVASKVREYKKEMALNEEKIINEEKRNENKKFKSLRNN